MVEPALTGQRHTRRHPMRIGAVVALAMLLSGCAMLACLPGCVRDTESNDQTARLIVYVSADDFLARQIIRAFEEESGIRVDMVGDSEVNKTTGLVTRIRSERENPLADVFWSSEAFMMIQLADEGLLEPFESAIVAEWPDALSGRDHLWHGFGSRARVIVYSPNRIEQDALPATWMDLADPRWRGRIVMADPRFGTTRGHMGAMKAFWDRERGEEYYGEYLRGLAANEVELLTSGNAGVVQAVASGEADLGMTDTDDVWAARRNGLAVDLIYPAHGEPGAAGEGTLLIPNTVAIIKGAAHREAAEQFVEFMLSERVARMMAESDSHNIPVIPAVAAEFSEYAVENPLDIDLSTVAAAMDGAVQAAMDALTADG